MEFDRPIAIALIIFIIFLIGFFLVVPEYNTFQKLEKEKHPEVKTKGIVINGNEEDLTVAINKLKETTDMEIHAMDVNQVPLDKHGNPDLTQKDDQNSILK